MIVHDFNPPLHFYWYWADFITFTSWSFSVIGHIFSPVLQGSILGQLALFMLPLDHILLWHDIKLNIYTEKPKCKPNILSCLSEIKTCMAQDYLNLRFFLLQYCCPVVTESSITESKGQCMYLGSYWGVICDSQALNFNQNEFISKKSFTDLEKVVHVFISSCLDDCNSIYSSCKHKILTLQMAWHLFFSRSRWGLNLQPKHCFIVLSFKQRALTDCTTGAQFQFHFVKGHCKTKLQTQSFYFTVSLFCFVVSTVKHIVSYINKVC